MLKYIDVLSDINTKLAPDNNIIADRHRDVNKSILDFANQWLKGDIKEVDCTDAYITANFDSNGTGKIGSEREGWQICNGNNGTKNRTGRVSVAYGKVTPIDSGNTPTTSLVGYVNWLPETGGSKNAVVVKHKHICTRTAATVRMRVSRKGVGGSGCEGSNYDIVSNEVGSDGTDKNMQPYIVTLFIQKL
jgi:hypothetical protein